MEIVNGFVRSPSLELRTSVTPPKSAIRSSLRRPGS